MIIAIVNQKGGVGKTTTTLNIGIGLANQGKKVLFIDMDQQANLSDTLQANLNKYTMIDVFCNNIKIANAIQKSEKFDVIVSNFSLSNAESALNTVVGKEFLMRTELEKIKDKYDVILIDTAPSLNVLTLNTLTCADGIIIPIQADVYSLQGLAQINKNLITPIKNYYNKALKIYGILVTRYKSRENLSKQLINELENITQKLDTKLFDTKIRECLAIRESQVYRTDIFNYAKNSNGAEDYLNLIKELNL